MNKIQISLHSFLTQIQVRHNKIKLQMFEI
jgi:hypothetical protein